MSAESARPEAVRAASLGAESAGAASLGAESLGAASLGAKKTYKLFVGGAFIRSESGRVAPVLDASGEVLARVPQSSRKDLRDAVVAARGAQPGWAASTAYLRGQILYRVAEMLDARSAQFTQELVAWGSTAADAAAEVTEAVDLWVWWAGWADKITQVLGGVNDVAGPFLNVSTPEPVGVAGLMVSGDRPLVALSSVLAPALCVGNAAVLVASLPASLATLTFGEVLATSDIPSGVANIVVGDHGELGPWLADHDDVDAIDLSGADPDTAADLVERSAGNLKRAFATQGRRSPQTASAFMDLKTVWHPARL
jgi:acyl-CoA reductase-like NAD-dependent aldehyde dehydrogenase